MLKGNLTIIQNMTKQPYKPRNPFSKSQYSKRRRFEENLRVKQEMINSGKWTHEDEQKTKFITFFALLFICIIIFFLFGPEFLLKWMSH